MSQRRPTEAEIRDARRLLGVGPGAGEAVILKAWRAAVRRNHPDAASEPDRARAEAVCSRINAAKDLLLEHPGAAAAGNGAGTTSRSNGNGRGPVTPPTRTTTANTSAGRRRQTASGAGSGAYVPTGVGAAGDLAPPRTGLLLAFLVMGVLALLAILAMTTHDDDSTQGSRIGGTPPGAATAVASGSVATTPSEAMGVLMGAAASRPDDLDGVVSPATRLADVRDIVTRIAALEPGARDLARSTTHCDAFQPGISDRAACAVEAPEDLLPHPVEMRRVDGTWRVLGYLPGR